MTVTITDISALQIFKCLGDDTRLKCVVLIAQFHEACVCELMDTLGQDQPKISRHLAMLRKCQLLQDERRGKWIYYRLHPELSKSTRQIIDSATEHDKAMFAPLFSQFSQCQVKRDSCC